MKFNEYLDMIESTGKEDLLKQRLSETKEYFSKAINVPVAGKIIRALIALSGTETIADFRQTTHYQNIKDWNVIVSGLENKNFKITVQPSCFHLKKLFKVLLFFVGVIFLYKQYKKHCDDQLIP